MKTKTSPTTNLLNRSPARSGNKKSRQWTYAITILLSFILIEIAQVRGSEADSVKFEQKGPKAGGQAPDFELKTLDGKTVKGSELWNSKPTVLIAGSYTCPVFRRTNDGYAGLSQEFNNKVNFVLLYTIEAHPADEKSPYFGTKKTNQYSQPQPKTAEERFALAKKCVEEEDFKGLMVIDTMDNTTWKAYGEGPNFAFLIGKGGKILAHQGIFDWKALRPIIQKYISQNP